MPEWTVYILECADGTLYTGITTDLDARVQKHESGLGAKYTRGRGPFTVIFSEHHMTRSDASKREREIKLMDRNAKRTLCGAD